MAGGGERHEHLRLSRSEPVNPRRTRRGFGKAPPPDPQKHGADLAQQLDDTLERVVSEPGFDSRRLLKLNVEGLEPTELEAIGGLQVISQEDKTVVVLFATAEGQQEFRTRLDLLSRGRAPTRKDILFAINGVSEWTPEDRIGGALRLEGLPQAARFILDVELWPLEKRGQQREPMRRAFSEWCSRAQSEVVDQLDQESIVLYRLEVDRVAYNRLLQHRDVRLVDLPPRYQLSDSELQVGLSDLGDIPAPPVNAPTLAVLDSGIVSNHPLLESAVGDAQSFLPELGAMDEHGHGTAVAGLALYGDVSECMNTRSFVPRVRILSGRITDHAARSKAPFIEKQIERAVEYFTETYGCRVFNLSFGDARKPYLGSHVRGIAVTLDTLSRKHGVLFVVSAGNYEGGEAVYQSPKWKTDYPSYLLERASARIIDPAPALNALTVGAIARFEKPRAAQRFAKDVAYHGAARRDQPSPFSRSGPGPGNAIKPDIVAYGGNYGVDLRDTNESRQLNVLLGEPAPAHEFAGGRLLRDFVGTSFAAPHVAHIAARLLGEYPTASANLLRALVVAHSAVPQAARELQLEHDDLRRLVGYGQPNAERCLYSRENCVSLIAEERIGENEHHFYEVPLPADFLNPSSRDRAITIAVSHMPMVRTTRFDYVGSRIAFRLVAEKELNAVTRVFRKAGSDEHEPMLKEFRTPNVGPQVRDKGTVQAATYPVRRLDDKTRAKGLFLVVTRSVPEWSRDLVPKENYALVIVLEDRSEQRVQYYQQIQIQLRQRARVRV